jgi:hypothetical protein
VSRFSDFVHRAEKFAGKAAEVSGLVAANILFPEVVVPVETTYAGSVLTKQPKPRQGSYPNIPDIPAPQAQTVIFGTVAGGGSAISATERAAWAQLRGQIGAAARGSVGVVRKIPGASRIGALARGSVPYALITGGYNLIMAEKKYFKGLSKEQDAETVRRTKALDAEIRARIKAKVLAGIYTGAQHLEPYKSGPHKGQLHIVATPRLPATPPGKNPSSTGGTRSPNPAKPGRPIGTGKGGKTATTLDPFDTNKLQAKQYDWLRKHQQVLGEITVPGGRYPIPQVPSKLSKAYAVAAAVFGLPNWNNPAQVARWITTLNPKKPGKTRARTVSAIRPGGGGSSVLRVAKPAKKKRRRRKKKAAKKTRTRRRLTRNRTRRVR